MPTHPPSSPKRARGRPRAKDAAKRTAPAPKRRKNNADQYQQTEDEEDADFDTSMPQSNIPSVSIDVEASESQIVPFIAPSSSQNNPPLSHLTPLQIEAHNNRLALQNRMDKGKGTDEAYPRHVKNYMKFWEADQDRRIEEDPNYVRIPAHPIIPEKVSLFLQHEITRNKVFPSHNYFYLILIFFSSEITEGKTSLAPH
jgi:hypothetical protein